MPMAVGGVPDIGDMSLTYMLDKLMELTLPVPNDHRQDNYCTYINIFLSAFGQERCMVVGSTKEGTRLRSEQDEGDYDYLLIGDITVPVECLIYREDLPCFVHIKGSFMADQLLKDQLVDGVYISTDLLKNLSPIAFARLKGIFDIVSGANTSHGRNTPHVAIGSSIKPGYSLTNYGGWKSEDLTVKRNPRSASDKALRKRFTERVKSSEDLQGDNNDVLTSFSTILDVIQGMKCKETSDGLIYQQFGPMLSALSGDISGLSMKRPKEDDVENAQESNPLSTADMVTEDIGGKQPKIQKSEGNITDIADIKMDTDHVEVSKHADGSSATGQGSKQKPDESDRKVKVTYNRKHKKDFIPAIPLSGAPKYIEQWLQRRAEWPHPKVRQVISKSQFLVVAKPALRDEKPDVDFCLSCNPAEIILAKEMPIGHKKCLLMIKAFQRTVLEEYTEILTTFHWKTAIYWMLESTSPSSYAERSEGVLDLLKTILDFMRERLHEERLEHYFFPSNLFAGMDTDVRVELVRKLEEIYIDPVLYLRSFFYRERERANQPRTMEIAADAMTKLKKNVEEKKDETNVDVIVNALAGFSRASTSGRGSSKEKPDIPTTLLQVAETVLADEDKRRKELAPRNPNEGRPTDVSKEELMSNMTKVLYNQGADRASRKQAREELKKNALFYLSGGKFK